MDYSVLFQDADDSDVGSSGKAKNVTVPGLYVCKSSSRKFVKENGDISVFPKIEKFGTSEHYWLRTCLKIVDPVGDINKGDLIYFKCIIVPNDKTINKPEQTFKFIKHNLRCLCGDKFVENMNQILKNTRYDLSFAEKLLLPVFSNPDENGQCKVIKEGPMQELVIANVQKNGDYLDVKLSQFTSGRRSEILPAFKNESAGLQSGFSTPPDDYRNYSSVESFPDPE